MGDGFAQLQKALTERAPKGFHWDSARYRDEDHGSTVLRAHYAGLRTIFADWQMPRDPDDGAPVGELSGVEKHYAELSRRYGYTIPIPENVLNNMGYGFLGRKRFDDAIAIFQQMSSSIPNRPMSATASVKAMKLRASLISPVSSFARRLRWERKAAIRISPNITNA